MPTTRLPRMAGRMVRLRLLLALVVLPILLWALLPLGAGAKPSLQDRISAKREAVESKRRRERVLTTDISAYTRRIGRLQSDIASLERRQVALQGDLDAKRAEVERVQERLRLARARLTRLREHPPHDREALAQRLVEIYKADRPDMVTVILESDGYADLLNRADFMRRVSHQDSRIMDLVRTAKAEATRIAASLDRLEARERRVADTIRRRRDEVAGVRAQLVDRRASYQVARTGRRELLVATRGDRKELEGDLRALEAEQAKVQAALRRAAGGGSTPAGPVRRGSGQLVWPVNGPVVSGFGMRWGRLHAGVDIAVPAGTPIRAAQSGRVVLLGWTGGYGNYTCIQHGGSLSTCYAHQSRYGTSNGASVSKGQVIGYVGCTGHCFGDHLHFETRINGSPVNPMGYL